VSPKYITFSEGSISNMDFATVKPPIPESNIPIGLRLFNFVTNIKEFNLLTKLLKLYFLINIVFTAL